MNQKWCGDLRHIRDVWCGAIECDTRSEIAQARREIIHHPTSPAKANSAIRIGCIGVRFQETGRNDEVLARFLLVELLKELACLVFIARISSERSKRVGS